MYNEDIFKEKMYLTSEKSMSAFDREKRQIVYVPLEQNGDYYSLSFLQDDRFKKLIGSRGIFSLIILIFLFPPLGFLLFGVFMLVLIFLGHREKMRNIADVLPFLHYKKMQEFEIHDFLKRFPHLRKEENKRAIPKSRNTQKEEEKDSKVTQLLDNEKSSWKYSQKSILKKKEASSTALPKSIFDDYESVMDKFKK